MQSKKYIAVLVILTSVTLVAGFLLWNSEDSHQIDSTRVGYGWARGPFDAPVTIDAYVTFT